MTKQFFILLVIGFLFVFSPSQVTLAEEETHEIKLISKLDLPEYIFKPIKIEKQDNLLWVSSMIRIPRSPYRTSLTAIDISDPANPKVVASHKMERLHGSFNFYQNYAYTIRPQRTEGIISDYYLDVYDMSEPGDPKRVNSLKIPHNLGSVLFINGDSIYIVGSEGGTLNAVRILKYSLDDPANPRFESDTFYDRDGRREWEYLQIGLSQWPILILPTTVFDNYVAGIAGSDFLLFKDTDEGINLVDGTRLPIESGWLVALAGEVMPDQSRFFYTAGNAWYPISSIDPDYFDSDEIHARSVITVVEHQLSGRHHFDREGVSALIAHGVPMRVTGLLAIKTLAFAIGYDEPSIHETRRTELDSKILIIDFKQAFKPRIVGEYHVDNRVVDYVQDGNIAYLLKTNNELEIVELPSSDEFFRRPWRTYVDPDVTPEMIIEERMRTALKQPEGELTKDDYERFTSFRINGYQFTDLEVMKDFKNLEGLSISRTGIYDLSPLKNMPNLKTLSLDSSDIRDLSPLAEIMNLETLRIRDLPVTDYSVIGSLKNLVLQ